MFHLIPPAGAPISFREIKEVIKSRIHSNSCEAVFKNKIKKHTGVRYCYLFNYGRTALLFILKALHDMAGLTKVEVVIPAYTCFSVAASIARTGLKIRLIDINPLTMDYDYDELSNLDFSKVLAVIACNLFGILSNWEKLLAIAREKRVFMVDDAAQSMGSSVKGRSSGSLGDAGFFSLGRGKNLSTYSGGILLTNSEEIAEKVEERIKGLAKPGLGREVKTLIEITLYSLFLRPKCFWLANMIPYLNLGKTIYDKTFSLGCLTESQKCAGSIFYSSLKWINTTRMENARKIARGILESGKYTIPGYDEEFCPAYLRLPLLSKDKTSRNRVIAALRKKGIVASTMYPSTIQQIPGIERHLSSSEGNFPGAQKVVDRLLTLPTHSYLSEKDLQRAISCLVEE
jgi:dTDP-4-amino-4,6-dideoxygalactose transaminase